MVDIHLVRCYYYKT